MESVETPLDRASAVNQFWNAHDEALFAQPVLTAVTDLSDAYFERGRWAGFGPRFLKLGRSVRYRKADVLDWMNQRPPLASTSETLPQPVAKRKARAKPRRVASKKRTRPAVGA